MKLETLKLNTKQEKAIADKILHELAVLAHLSDVLPKGRDKFKRKWTEGLVFGIKYSILHVAGKMNDPEKKKLYEKLIDWEKEEECLFGKKGYKKLKELKKEKGI
jgi:hypothetical protein